MSKKKERDCEHLLSYMDRKGSTERLPVSTLVTIYAVLIKYMPHSPVCSECIRFIIVASDNVLITLH